MDMIEQHVHMYKIDMQLLPTNGNTSYEPHRHLPNFLPPQDSCVSQFFGDWGPCLGWLYSFDMPPTSYTEYMLDKCQSIIYIYKVKVGMLGIKYHFFRNLPEFYKVHPLLITHRLHRRSFCNQMQRKRIKVISLQIVSALANRRLHHLKTTLSNYSIICVNVELCLFIWKNVYKI